MNAAEAEVSPLRVSVEFAGLMLLVLSAYGLQAISEVVGEVLAIPLYVLFATFFVVRGSALARVNGLVVAAVMGERAGRAAMTLCAWWYRFLGIVGLAAIPVWLVVWLLEG